MNKETKLFTLIGPPEAGKMALAEALAKAFDGRIELAPRLTDKPPERIDGSAGYVRRVTPTTLRRHVLDGRLILTRANEHVSGFDRERIDRLLQKRNVILVTTEDGVRELQRERDDSGSFKYKLVVIRVVPPRKPGTDTPPPPSGLTADFEILSAPGPDHTAWAVRELSRHFDKMLA
jgi:hypothetical protein